MACLEIFQVPFKGILEYLVPTLMFGGEECTSFLQPGKIGETSWFAEDSQGNAVPDERRA